MNTEVFFLRQEKLVLPLKQQKQEISYYIENLHYLRIELTNQNLTLTKYNSVWVEYKTNPYNSLNQHQQYSYGIQQ